MDSGSSFDLKVSLPGSSKLNGKAREVLHDLNRCFDDGERWKELTPVQRITLEEYGTVKLLELIKLYNRHVSRSIQYGLREKTEEEEVP